MLVLPEPFHQTPTSVACSLWWKVGEDVEAAREELQKLLRMQDLCFGILSEVAGGSWMA